VFNVLQEIWNLTSKKANTREKNIINITRAKRSLLADIQTTYDDFDTQLFIASISLFANELHCFSTASNI
jgi:hypothetical protein